MHIRECLVPLKIVDKKLAVLTLGDVLTWPQEVLLESINNDLRDRKPIRKIILKARQTGISTIVQGLQFSAAFALPRMQGMVIAHKSESSQHLLGMNKFYWDTSDYKRSGLYTTKHYAVNALGWEETGSKIRVITAGSKEGARSFTAQFVHGSEVAFWPDPQILMDGLANAVPREPFTSFILESTANGVGNWFYKAWQAAKAGEYEFDPLFFPWWRHPFYTADHIGLGYKAEQLFKFDDEEKIIAKGLKRALHLDDRDIRARLVWRRSILNTECGGDLDKLHQEFPTTDDEAFLSTGRNVFPLDQLKAVYEPMRPDRGRLEWVGESGGSVKFVADPSGPLHIYRYPSRRAHYMLGGDPSKAVMFGDYAVCQVINRATWEQCAVWRMRSADPVYFAEEMLKMGRYFNMGMLAPENNMSGGAVAAILQREYPNLYIHRKTNKVRGQIDQMVGWITNQQTKAEAIGNLQAAIREAATPESRERGVGIRIHDPATFEEMKGYVVLETGRFGNGDETQHDDTVMAMAIAMTCTMHEMHSLAFNHSSPALARAASGGVVVDANPTPVPSSLEYADALANQFDAVGAVDSGMASMDVDTGRLMFESGPDWGGYGSDGGGGYSDLD